MQSVYIFPIALEACSAREQQQCGVKCCFHAGLTEDLSTGAP